MLDRRDFLSGAAALASTAAVPAAAAADPKFLRMFFIRLGMSIEYDQKKVIPINFNEKLWNHQFAYAQKIGLNSVLIDVLDAVKYESHPEVAAPDAKSVDWLRAEVKRIRAMGLEPFPKLNFSATHDGWLGPWRFCRCTPKYYETCNDIIREVYDIFGKPRLFHIGMDEETESHQKTRDLVCYRRGDLWWHDLYKFVGDVERCGARACMWCDYGWRHGDEFLKRLPKSVIATNAHYDSALYGFDPERKPEGWYQEIMQKSLKLMIDLDKKGIDQIPCGSTWNSPYRRKRGVTLNDSMLGLMKFSRKYLSPERLKGFLMASWADYQYESQREINEFAMELLVRENETGEAAGSAKVRRRAVVKSGKTPKEAAYNNLRSLGFGSPTCVDEKIDGATAVVRMKATSEGRVDELKVRCVKAGAGWRVDGID